MSKREHTQGASASIVIIAILFLALMGTLGVVFYQNFVSKPARQTNTTRTDVKDTIATDVATKRVAFNSAIYAFEYPKAWSVMTNPMQGSKQGATITSFINPAKTVSVVLKISEAVGGGGSCNINTEQKISSYNVVDSLNTKLAGQALSLVEALYDYPGGGYQYNIGLSEDGGETHAAVGDPFCSVSNTFFASHATFNADGTLNQPTISLTVEFPKLPIYDKGPAAPDMQTIKNLMNSDDYKAAVKILESARKE